MSLTQVKRVTKSRAGFLQSSSGENSSKRLSYSLCVITCCFGMLISSNSLIVQKAFNDAIELWKAFFLLTAVLGGFVTAELLVLLLKIYKGQNDTVTSDSVINPDGDRLSSSDNEEQNRESKERD